MSQGPNKCANGCDAPVDPPSRVICRKCQDNITQKLEEWTRVHWSSAVVCEHANEVPSECTCPDGCYCRSHTCVEEP